MMVASPPKPQLSVWANLGRRLVDLVIVSALFVLLLTAAGYLGRLAWWLELLCHGRVQYFWLLALAAAMLLVARRWRMGAAAAIGAFVNLAVIVPIYWPVSLPQNAGQPLHIMSFNRGGGLTIDPVHDAVLSFRRIRIQ